MPAEIATAAIPLVVTPPRAEQYLRATLQADRTGYYIALSGVDGHPPPLHGPAWGAVAATSVNGSMAEPLAVTTDGVWAGTWSSHLGTGGRPRHVTGWVAARGYVPAVISTTVAGTKGTEDR